VVVHNITALCSLNGIFSQGSVAAHYRYGGI